VLLPCAPDKVDQVLESLQVELQKLKVNGPELTDLNKVKSNLTITHRKNLEDNKAWQSLLERTALSEAKVNNFMAYPSRFNKVTVEDIKLTANRYLNPANSILSILNPEK
jgi:zinc protease